jgi:hypothetical protein
MVAVQGVGRSADHETSPFVNYKSGTSITVYKPAAELYSMAVEAN